VTLRLATVWWSDSAANWLSFFSLALRSFESGHLPIDRQNWADIRLLSVFPSKRRTALKRSTSGKRFAHGINFYMAVPAKYGNYDTFGSSALRMRYMKKSIPAACLVIVATAFEVRRCRRKTI
jgi:hypothetical protein